MVIFHLQKWLKKKLNIIVFCNCMHQDTNCFEAHDVLWVFFKIIFTYFHYIMCFSLFPWFHVNEFILNIFIVNYVKKIIGPN